MALKIVGLGPGALDDLSLKAWRTLKNAEHLYLRTAQHACVVQFAAEGIHYQSFDSIYESHDDFDTVYQTIVERLLDAAAVHEVVYAVPGDPLVGESTTLRLLAAAQQTGLDIEIINGISFIEPILPLIGLDAMNGLQVLDGLDVATMHHPPINPDYPALLGQVYSQAVASDVKLTLMNQYPDDFPVRLIHSAGTPDAIVESLPLYEIDHSEQIAHTTSLYLPALGEMSSFEQFQEVIAHLRAPEGCPWDREQTHESLRRYLLEEAYEVIEAIDNDDPQALAEELGDVLLQIVLHTQIATEDGDFTMPDVLRYVNAKMIRRHPHVWGAVDVHGDPDEVVTNWDAIKKAEKAEKGDQAEGFKSVLAGIPPELPALMVADQYQARAAKINFDWDKLDEVLAKVEEEIAELKAAETPEARQDELGDVLFTIVNWARWLGVEPETALRQTNRKFYRRFQFVEEAISTQGKAMTDCSLAELDALWDAAKAQGL